MNNTEYNRRYIREGEMVESYSFWYSDVEFSIDVNISPNFYIPNNTSVECHHRVVLRMKEYNLENKHLLDKLLFSYKFLSETNNDNSAKPKIYEILNSLDRYNPSKPEDQIQIKYQEYRAKSDNLFLDEAGSVHIDDSEHTNILYSLSPSDKDCLLIFTSIGGLDENQISLYDNESRLPISDFLKRWLNSLTEIFGPEYPSLNYDEFEHGKGNLPIGYG